MDNAHFARISVTPTVARQTPKNDFGQVLNNSLNGVLQAGSVVGSLTGMPIISSAVSAVSSLVNGTGSSHNNNGMARNSSAVSGTINIGTASPGIGSIEGAGGGVAVGSTVQTTGSTTRGSSASGVEPAGMDNMLSGMRAEADRSMTMQLKMQNESREYNTLTNILKLRHDSAKAAINNIR